MLWIGGPPGAGKTTVATRLARRHGLRWYCSDWRTWEHRDRAIRAGNPAAIRWEALTPDERRNVPPAERLAMSLHRERGPMLVDDLLALPPVPLIVAEGSTVAPDFVSSGVADPSRAVWLVPSPRPSDVLAAEIEREVEKHAVPTLAVDRTRGIDAAVAAVEEHFALALAEGPRTKTPAERTALLRKANEAIVSQVRGYHARPWAEGEAESVLREFVCECGAPECDASVELPVGAVASAPALAH